MWAEKPTTTNQNNHNMNRIDNDFFSVEEDYAGNKRIHMLGYCYHCDTPDEKGRDYRAVEYTFFYLPIGFTMEQFDTGYDECEKYIYNHDEDSIIDYMDDYVATPLSLWSVTEDTPCGIYINCQKKTMTLNFTYPLGSSTARLYVDVEKSEIESNSDWVHWESFVGCECDFDVEVVGKGDKVTEIHFWNPNRTKRTESITHDIVMC